ncbi:MAG: AEC family transporter, partial [Streptococcus sp.]|nr:AEC family transporter [Streptococcus sp.]
VPVGRRGVMLNTFVNANTVFMGLPLNLSLFGEEAMPYFLVYYVINTLSIFTVGTYVVAIDRPDGNKTRGIQWKSLCSPPLIAFLVALAVVALGIPVPTFAQNSINIVGSLVTPLSLMYIGINLQQSGLGTLRIDRDIVLALAGRFIIFPMLMVLVLLVGGADNTLLKETFIIQSTIPTLVIMPILAAEAKGDVDFATNVVTMTTIAYLAVLPLWSLFLFFI